MLHHRAHHPLSRLLITVIVIIALCAGGWGVSTGEEGSTAAPLQFTQAQAAGGKVLYRVRCASCHGTALEGTDGPPLVGESFSHWSGASVADLHAYIAERMPAGNPGSLNPDQVSVLIAYLAAENGLQPSSTALPAGPDDLAGLVFGQ